MPTPPLDEPGRKISVDIYLADYEELKRIYGYGWSGQVRMIIRDHLRIRRGVAQLMKRAEKENADAKRD